MGRFTAGRGLRTSFDVRCCDCPLVAMVEGYPRVRRNLFGWFILIRFYQRAFAFLFQGPPKVFSFFLIGPGALFATLLLLLSVFGDLQLFLDQLYDLFSQFFL